MFTSRDIVTSIQSSTNCNLTVCIVEKEKKCLMLLDWPDLSIPDSKTGAPPTEPSCYTARLGGVYSDIFSKFSFLFLSLIKRIKKTVFFYINKAHT